MWFFGRIKNKIKYEVLRRLKPEIIGYARNFQGQLTPDLRISNLAHIGNKSNVFLGSHVYVAHFSFIEGFERVTIGEGTAINSYVSILTHSAHNSMRLYGMHYNDFSSSNMKGHISAEVKIGNYTFIGPNTVIMPGTVIGNGCIVAAFSFVSGQYDDYSIIRGNPAKVVGDTRKIDEAFLHRYPELNDFYYAKRLPQTQS
jgi:acetyltransferase-like isoleucine patch superfamily enzyme